MLWNVQHVRHQKQDGLNILNDSFFSRLPWTRGETSRPLPFSPVSVVADVARHRINHHGSCPDDWYAGDTLCRRCLWAARNCNGFFWVRPKKRLVSIPKIAKICQNLGFLMGFCMFLTKKQKHALCIHVDLSCKKFRIFRMGLETKVSQRAHCNCNGPGGGPVDRNCGTFQAPKFFDEVFEKMTDPTLPSHDPWWWWRSRFGWSQFCKESFMGIPKHTKTINFPAEKEGICLLKTGNHHAKSSCLHKSPGELPGWRHDSRRDTKMFRARSPRTRQITLEDPLGWGWGKCDHFSADSNYESNLYYYEVDFKCHSFGKMALHQPKKIDACPGSFLVREAARAEGLCCRDASTLDKLQYSAFDGRKIGRGSPWS